MTTLAGKLSARYYDRQEYAAFTHSGILVVTAFVWANIGSRVFHDLYDRFHGHQGRTP